MESNVFQIIWDSMTEDADYHSLQAGDLNLTLKPSIMVLYDMKSECKVMQCSANNPVIRSSRLLTATVYSCGDLYQLAYPNYLAFYYKSNVCPKLGVLVSMITVNFQSRGTSF